MSLISRVADAVRRSGLPGLVAIVSEGGVRDEAASGVRRLGHPELLEPGDRLHIGSCTKSITAAVIGAAVEQGELGWGTSVGEVFDHSGPYASVTVTDLLSHRGGLQPFEEDHEFEALGTLPTDPVSHRAAFAELVLGLTPVNEPTTDFVYSNAGYAVATAMLERATDATWESLCETRIFKPLGLDAGFGWPARNHSQAPWGHHLVEDRLEAHDPNGTYQLEPSIAPAGDIAMPVPHYVSWLEANLAGLGGSALILSQSTWEKIHSPHGRAGLGWGIQDLQGRRASVHTGSADTMFLLGVIVPEVSMAIAIGSNATWEVAQEPCVDALKAILVERLG